MNLKHFNSDFMKVCRDEQMTLQQISAVVEHCRAEVEDLQKTAPSIPFTMPAKKKTPWWKDPKSGPIKQATKHFIDTGEIVDTYTGNAIYSVAADLISHGWTPDRVEDILREKTKLSDAEIIDVIDCAILRDCNIMPSPKAVAKTK